MGSLRRETAAEHALLEQETRMMASDLSVGDYRRFLARMWAAHAAIEPCLESTAGLAAVVPDLASRRKLPLLTRDLERLGAAPGGLGPLPAPLARPHAGLAECLGALYVLEGATLGAPFIRRHVAEVLGARVTGATSYLDACLEPAASWRRFGAAVDAYASAHPRAESRMVAAAVATFQALRAGWREN